MKRWQQNGIIGFAVALCFLLPLWGFLSMHSRILGELNAKQAEASTLVSDSSVENPVVKTEEAYTSTFYEHVTNKQLTQSEAERILLIIAKCESGNNPLARSTTSSAKGLLQILDGTWRSFACTGNVFDKDDNFRCGVKIATESGFQHWDSSRYCWGPKI